jgi:hypothetical protein
VSALEMITTFEELILELDKQDRKIVFLVGDFDDFAIHNFAIDNNYLYVVFEQFLDENKISSAHFKDTDAIQSTRVSISIDKWTQQLAFQSQKQTVVIDGFSLSLLHDLLTKKLLMEELLYISKNSNRLVMNVVIVINTNLGKLEEQILPKILENSLVVRM